MASHSSIATIAKEFGLTYQETRKIIKDHGVKMRRGRVRGSGSGLELSVKSRTNRAISWLAKRIEEGRCTSCSGKNDSDSLYHCLKCLDARNSQAKKRNTQKKGAEVSAENKKE